MPSSGRGRHPFDSAWFAARRPSRNVGATSLLVKRSASDPTPAIFGDWFFGSAAPQTLTPGTISGAITATPPLLTIGGLAIVAPVSLVTAVATTPGVAVGGVGMAAPVALVSVQSLPPGVALGGVSIAAAVATVTALATAPSVSTVSASTAAICCIWVDAGPTRRLNASLRPSRDLAVASVALTLGATLIGPPWLVDAQPCC